MEGEGRGKEIGEGGGRGKGQMEGEGRLRHGCWRYGRPCLSVNVLLNNILFIITSAEGGYVFTSVCLSACLSVCLSVA